MSNTPASAQCALEDELAKLEAELGLNLEPDEIARKIHRLTAIKGELRRLRDCCEPPKPTPDYEEPDSGMG